VAVDHLNIEVLEGQVFGLLGSNGAGKTTTMKIFATLLRPTSGRALFMGRDITRNPAYVRQRTGYLPENPQLYDEMTAYEFLHMVGVLRSIPEDEIDRRIEDLAAMLELEDKMEVQLGRYSRGMRQKISFASAVIHRPPVLLLDEPTSGLDPRFGRMLRAWIKEYCRRGGTALINTHLTHPAEDMCTHIGIIHNGKLLMKGTLKEVLERTSCETLEEAFVEVVGEGDWELSRFLE